MKFALTSIYFIATLISLSFLSFNHPSFNFFCNLKIFATLSSRVGHAAGTLQDVREVQDLVIPYVDDYLRMALNATCDYHNNSSKLESYKVTPLKSYIDVGEFNSILQDSNTSELLKTV